MCRLDFSCYSTQCREVAFAAVMARWCGGWRRPEWYSRFPFDMAPPFRSCSTTRVGTLPDPTDSRDSPELPPCRTPHHANMHTACSCPHLSPLHPLTRQRTCGCPSPKPLPSRTHKHAYAHTPRPYPPPPPIYKYMNHTGGCPRSCGISGCGWCSRRRSTASTWSFCTAIAGRWLPLCWWWRRPTGSSLEASARTRGR